MTLPETGQRIGLSPPAWRYPVSMPIHCLELVSHGRGGPLSPGKQSSTKVPGQMRTWMDLLPGKGAAPGFAWQKGVRSGKKAA